jgi:hypothetical protein
MAYKVEFKDFERVEKLLDTYAKKSTSIAKQMVYVGAGDIADAVRASLQSKLSDKATGSLLDGLDTTPIKVNGSVVGNYVRFDGYDNKGTPRALIAAVLESGRSDQPNREATHFFSNAVRATRGKALNDMTAKFDEIVEKISKSGD